MCHPECNIVGERNEPYKTMNTREGHPRGDALAGALVSLLTPPKPSFAIRLSQLFLAQTDQL